MWTPLEGGNPNPTDSIVNSSRPDMSNNTSLGLEVARATLRSLVNVRADDDKLHESLRDMGYNPTDYFKKLNDIVQDDEVVRCYYEMLLSRSVDKMKLEHSFATILEVHGGVPPNLEDIMLAMESTRSTVVDPVMAAKSASRAAKSASRKARRSGAKSSKRN